MRNGLITERQVSIGCWSCRIPRLVPIDVIWSVKCPQNTIYQAERLVLLYGRARLEKSQPSRAITVDCVVCSLY